MATNSTNSASARPKNQTGNGTSNDFILRPIIEYYEVDWVESKGKAGYEFLDDSNQRQKELKNLLSTKHGVYIFYDSMGRAIYVGKAKDTTLAVEMKSAYNRDRPKYQRIWGVKHVFQQRKFDPSKEARRPIRQFSLALHDIATFFSAYEIRSDLINHIEALLIRAFANQLTNKRQERFPS